MNLHVAFEMRKCQLLVFENSMGSYYVQRIFATEICGDWQHITILIKSNWKILKLEEESMWHLFVSYSYYRKASMTWCLPYEFQVQGVHVILPLQLTQQNHCGVHTNRLKTRASGEKLEITQLKLSPDEASLMNT